MKPEEIRKEVDSAALRSVWLENNSGTAVYPKNRPGRDVNSHLDDIFRLLDSKGIPNGIYFVCGKQRQSMKVEPMRFRIIKGEEPVLAENSLTDKSTGTQMHVNSPIFDPASFIQLNADLASTKAENTIFRQQIARLELELDAANERVMELLDKLSDNESIAAAPPAPSLMESLPKFLEAAAPFAPLIVEMVRRPQPQPIQQPIPQAPQAIAENAQENLSNDHKGNVDHSRYLEMLLRNEPETLEKFLSKYYDLSGGEEDGGNFGEEFTGELNEEEVQDED